MVLHTGVQLHVDTTENVGISVRNPVTLAIHARMAKSPCRNMAPAHRDAVGTTLPAGIPVPRCVTMAALVRLVLLHARSVAATRDAARLVMSRAPRAQNPPATRVAPMRAAACHALHHAIGCHALDAVRNYWDVAISVSHLDTSRKRTVANFECRSIPLQRGLPGWPLLSGLCF